VHGAIGGSYGENAGQPVSLSSRRGSTIAPLRWFQYDAAHIPDIEKHANAGSNLLRTMVA
jgi:hypothetical protein